MRFLTLYDLKNVASKLWEDWASTDDTLVFYMSGQRLETLTNILSEKGINSSKGIAVVQQATTPFQKTRVFTFEELKNKKLPDFEFVPTIIIIGNVVNLHKQFNWVQELNTAESYFDNHKNTYQNAI